MKEKHWQMCNYLSIGWSAEKIAGRMKVSPRTVEGWIARLMKQYATFNTTHLIATLLRSGEIT